MADIFLNTRSGTVSTLCFVLPFAYSRFIAIMTAKIHGKSMTKIFAQTPAFPPVELSHERKFSLLINSLKKDMQFALNVSKSAGKITSQFSTFERSATDGIPSTGKPNNTQK